MPSPPVTTASASNKAIVPPSDDRPMIIEVNDLSKIYDIGTPRETRALEKVSFEISLAEIVILFGPSGSGKSTMLNILAGLDEPTGGTIKVDGKDLSKMTAHDKALYHQFKVGMVFQSYNLVPTFTVMQNITMPARLAGFKRETYKARGRDLLRQFELEKLADRLPADISGGQQQRVGIMRAFMNRPSFIIADEPTGNLDSSSSEHIMGLFKKLNEETNTTMVIVTHDPSLFAIADRVIHILDGHVVKQTIFTPKAKIDVSKANVPVEFKLKPEERAAMISSAGGAKTGPTAITKEVITRQQEDKRLIHQEEELRREYERLDKEYKTITAQLAQQAKLDATRIKEYEQLLAEKKQLEEAVRHLAREERLLAQEKEEVDFAKQFIAQEQQRLAAEEQRLAEALRQPQQEQHKRAQAVAALRAQQASVAVEREQLRTARQSLARERARFEQDIQQRIAVANNIIDHEREQLETEREQQEADAKQRAEDMNRKLTAAKQIIKREATRLSAEQHLLARQRQSQERYLQQLETEKQQLEQERERLLAQLAHTIPAPPTPKKHAAPRPHVRSTFDRIVAERFSLSPTAQYIVESLVAVVPPAQQQGLSRQQIFRMIEAIEFRLYEVYDAAELRNFLDRPLREGGVGLYKQTAQHLADSIEAMIKLGKLGKKTK